MNCPIKTGGSAELLLAYGTRKLDAEAAALLERHIEICPACREVAGNHRSVWEALDAWTAPPVSVDFDRRLYQRIEKEISWWDLLIRPFRPMLLRQVIYSRGLPIAAAAFVMVMAGALLQRPATVEPGASAESAQLESVQPEQVEHALDAMQMLSDFSHQVRAAANESEM